MIDVSQPMYFITRLLLIAASVVSLPARLVHPIVVKRWENRQPSRFLFSIQPAAPTGTGAQAPAGPLFGLSGVAALSLPATNLHARKKSTLCHLDRSGETACGEIAGRSRLGVNIYRHQKRNPNPSPIETKGHVLPSPIKTRHQSKPKSFHETLLQT
jgi:hypothetical protein